MTLEQLYTEHQAKMEQIEGLRDDLDELRKKMLSYNPVKKGVSVLKSEFVYSDQKFLAENVKMKLELDEPVFKVTGRIYNKCGNLGGRYGKRTISVGEVLYSQKEASE